jgi:hypothetical protein
MLDYWGKLKIDLSKLWVPFLIINSKDECKYIGWDKDIMNFFQAKIDLCQTNMKMSGLSKLEMSGFICIIRIVFLSLTFI